MALRYSVKLQNSAKTERDALKALKGAVNDMLRKATTQITIKLRVMIKDAIRNTPEYQSINGGTLQGELGLPSPTLLDDIIDVWANTIVVTVKPVRVGTKGISGGFKIGAIPKDWALVLAHPSASVLTKKGAVLPWLEWLLLMGNKVIVRDYEVVVTSDEDSRSGKAVMVKNIKKRWRVPPNFSGTSSNNFATRAIDAAFPDIQVMILEEVLKAVK